MEVTRISIMDRMLSVNGSYNSCDTGYLVSARFWWAGVRDAYQVYYAARSCEAVLCHFPFVYRDWDKPRSFDLDAVPIVIGWIQSSLSRAKYRIQMTR